MLYYYLAIVGYIGLTTQVMTVYKQHVHYPNDNLSILDLVSQNLTELVPSQLGIELSWIRRWGPVDVALLEEFLFLCWTLYVFMTGNNIDIVCILE